MIIDSMDHLKRYDIPRMQGILDFLKKHSPASIVNTVTEIDGNDLLVRTGNGPTRPASEGRFEVHRHYLDLQYVYRGQEVMQVAPQEALRAVTEFDEVHDYQFFDVEKDVSSFLVREGDFAVFWPGEAHRPGCSPEGGPVNVGKLIFKVRILS